MGDVSSGAGVGLTAAESVEENAHSLMDGLDGVFALRVQDKKGGRGGRGPGEVDPAWVGREGAVGLFVDECVACECEERGQFIAGEEEVEPGPPLVREV